MKQKCRKCLFWRLFWSKNGECGNGMENKSISCGLENSVFYWYKWELFKNVNCLISLSKSDNFGGLYF